MCKGEETGKGDRMGRPRTIADVARQFLNAYELLSREYPNQTVEGLVWVARDIVTSVGWGDIAKRLREPPKKVVSPILEPVSKGRVKQVERVGMMGGRYTSLEVALGAVLANGPKTTTEIVDEFGALNWTIRTQDSSGAPTRVIADHFKKRPTLYQRMGSKGGTGKGASILWGLKPKEEEAGIFDDDDFDAFLREFGK